MIDVIRNVVILGSSGTIGSLTGGIIAQQGIKVYFLSRTLEGAKAGLKRALSQARSEVISRYIECGDYTHILEEALREADLIIESVTENLEVKKKMYEMVERYRKPDAIIGSTTSSLPLNALVEDRSDSFKENFLSTHFYNPPGKMLACEVAGTEWTNPQVYNFIQQFLEKQLRRKIIHVNNIPAFAGNRIAFTLFNRITVLVEEYGVEIMDYLLGPYTGRLMPPLATIDLVGLDIHRAIIHSLQQHTHDYLHDTLAIPEYINKMIGAGLLGNKAKGGFYKKQESGKLTFFDPDTSEYIPAIEPHIAFVEKAKRFIRIGMYKEAFDIIKRTRGSEAEIVKEILCTYVAYAYSLIGQVTESGYGIEGIDKVMCYGFNWAPPSTIVDMLGSNKEVIILLEENNCAIPQALKENVRSLNKIPNSGKYFIAR